MLLSQRRINYDIEEGKGHHPQCYGGPAACDFDLLFTYVLTGWEGSTHDSCIFLDAIANPSLNFPKPPHGNFLHFS